MRTRGKRLPPAHAPAQLQQPRTRPWSGGGAFAVLWSNRLADGLHTAPSPASGLTRRTSRVTRPSRRPRRPKLHAFGFVRAQPGDEHAVVLFERLLSLRNDVGLLSEEWDPKAGRQLGKTPQAFSHFPLIVSALAFHTAATTAATRPCRLPPADRRQRPPRGPSDIVSTPAGGGWPRHRTLDPPAGLIAGSPAETDARRRL